MDSPTTIENKTQGDIDLPKRVRCYVCLGKINDAGDSLECPRCGKAYHKACARRIMACVICGTDLAPDEAP